MLKLLKKISLLYIISAVPYRANPEGPMNNIANHDMAPHQEFKELVGQLMINRAKHDIHDRNRRIVLEINRILEEPDQSRLGEIEKLLNVIPHPFPQHRIIRFALNNARARLNNPNIPADPIPIDTFRGDLFLLGMERVLGLNPVQSSYCSEDYDKLLAILLAINERDGRPNQLEVDEIGKLVNKLPVQFQGRKIIISWLNNARMRLNGLDIPPYRIPIDVHRTQSPILSIEEEGNIGGQRGNLLQKLIRYLDDDPGRTNLLIEVLYLRKRIKQNPRNRHLIDIFESSVEEIKKWSFNEDQAIVRNFFMRLESKLIEDSIQDEDREDDLFYRIDGINLTLHLPRPPQSPRDITGKNVAPMNVKELFRKLQRMGPTSEPMGDCFWSQLLDYLINLESLDSLQESIDELERILNTLLDQFPPDLGSQLFEQELNLLNRMNMVIGWAMGILSPDTYPDRQDSHLDPGLVRHPDHQDSRLNQQAIQIPKIRFVSTPNTFATHAVSDMNENKLPFKVRMLIKNGDKLYEDREIAYIAYAPVDHRYLANSLRGRNSFKIDQSLQFNKHQLQLMLRMLNLLNLYHNEIPGTIIQRVDTSTIGFSGSPGPQVMPLAKLKASYPHKGYSHRQAKKELQYALTRLSIIFLSLTSLLRVLYT